ncbi:nucleotide sugar dehydrogenase [Streptomyces sp. NPDC060031]|uniref:nucleotide sugar dehydrogenase n=1 Tax=Streptomyces sp. NPDC060031 TaxID=3347043 RepID=UPI0036A1AAFF
MYHVNEIEDEQLRKGFTFVLAPGRDPLLAEMFLDTEDKVAELSDMYRACFKANTFLGLKISYINAVADMCDAAGGDISQIVEILGIDPRIGSGGMRPGIGYGGGCLPKDVRAFTASARQLGAEQAATLLRAAEKINESRTDVAMDLIRNALGDRAVKNAKITVWGAAFKPGTNDVRESPALALAHALQQTGATVTVHDPQAMATAMTRIPELDYTDDLAASVDGADLVVLATEWPEYQQADPKDLADRAASPLLVDCRTTLDPEPLAHGRLDRSPARTTREVEAAHARAADLIGP